VALFSVSLIKHLLALSLNPATRVDLPA